MPLHWKIAPLERMVVCVAEGAVTIKDLMEYFAALEAAGASDYSTGEGGLFPASYGRPASWEFRRRAAVS